MNNTHSNISRIKQQALACLKNQQPAEARALLERICVPGSKDIDAWHILGTIYGMLGLYEQCAHCSRQVVKLQPGAFSAYNNLGRALMALGEFDDARSCFEKSLKINPDNAETYNYLGNLLTQASDSHEAIPYLEKAVSLAPGYAEAHYNLGLAFKQSGDTVKAELSLAQACRLQPGSAQLLHTLGSVQYSAGNIIQAINTCRDAIKLDPDNAIYHTELGNLCNEAGDHHAATSAFREAVRCMPNSAEAHYNLGHALQISDNFESAVQSYQEATRLKPDLVVAYNNMGQAYESLGQLDKAMECFNRGLDIQAGASCAPPEYPDPGVGSNNIQPSPLAEIHWHRALLRLLTGNFHEGWPEYEWRWAGNTLAYRPFPQPLWEGQPLQGKTILVYAEQGVGDELMFAHCIPAIVSQADHVIIDCEPRLAPLFQRSFPTTTVHGGTQTDDLSWLSMVPQADFQTAIGSLPLRLNISLDNPPGHGPYLLPEDTELARWRERYEALGPGLKIGISWRGGNPKKIRHRSTPLTLWKEILAIPGIHYINLQYGNCDDELAEAEKLPGIKIYGWPDADPLKDLDSFSAQIAALDLVISIDNSTVHMAGAVGTPTWTLLPFSPEWRWLTERKDSYWYDNMRLFRQPKPDSWDSVLADIFRNIHNMKNNKEGKP